LLALATLESFNLVHGDIKEGNVFIQKNNTVKLGFVDVIGKYGYILFVR
jgi:Ser/Thr protein kinase RdoA (MazF antagonist)